jgi:hypothetical protein
MLRCLVTRGGCEWSALRWTHLYTSKFRGDGYWIGFIGPRSMIDAPSVKRTVAYTVGWNALRCSSSYLVGVCTIKGNRARYKWVVNLPFEPPLSEIPLDESHCQESSYAEWWRETKSLFVSEFHVSTSRPLPDWSRSVVNLLKPNGTYMYQLLQQCQHFVVMGFWMILSVNSDYFFKQL